MTFTEPELLELAPLLSLITLTPQSELSERVALAAFALTSFKIEAELFAFPD